MICIIPQHGGSERIPGKAFRSFCGRPLVAWAVAQALSAECIDEVYVSTESKSIADICEPLGAEIIWRPPSITDKKYAASVPLRHAMEKIGDRAMKGPTVHMLATTPLKKPGDIDRMYKRYMETPEFPDGLTKAVYLAANVQEVNTARSHVPGPNGYPRGRSTFTDKRHDMLATIGGVGVVDAEGLREAHDRVAWAYGEDTDVTTDDQPHDWYLVGLGSSGAAMWYYVPCELWQTFEIDGPEDFKICEMFMDKYILKGRTMEEVYG